MSQICRSSLALRYADALAVLGCLVPLLLIDCTACRALL